MSGGAYDDGNIFARILRGEITSHSIYEDDSVIAIMDVMPQGKGHCLVIPRAPSRTLLDMAAHDLQALALAVQRVARAAVKALDAQGATIINYCEAAGGQTVFHTHVHVIPRFDGVPLKPHAGGMANTDELADQAFAIKAALGGST